MSGLECPTLPKNDFNKKFSHFQVFFLLKMSKWQILIKSELTESEKLYFQEKCKDGMCQTKNGHLCFVGMDGNSKKMTVFFQKKS